MDFISDASRQLIPRWHTSRKLVSLSRSEMKSYADKSKARPDDFKVGQSIAKWKEDRNLANAIDVLAKTKLVEGVDEEISAEVAKYLKSNIDKLSPAVSELVTPSRNPLDEADLYSIENQKIYSIIAKLKTRLREYPKDPFTWNDLAFYYAVLGQQQHALNSMNIGFEASDSHPALARAFARLALEGEESDPEKALSIISKSKRRFSHPFLDSAELAIQLKFDTGNPNISKARKIIDSFPSRPDLITELAAAVATEELANGATRNARKKFKISALSPTENTISQLHWVHARKDLDLEEILNGIRKSVEAKVFELHNQEKFTECRAELLHLHEFQPFTPQALIYAGYISLAALADNDFVINTFNRFRSITNRDLVARNNYAVALLESTDNKYLGEAEKIVTFNMHEAKSDPDRMMCRATLALYSYKIGKSEIGRELYKQAISKFKQSNLYSQAANALFHYGKEESQLDSEVGLKLLKEASEIIEEKKVALTIKSRLNEMIKDLESTVQISDK